MDVWQGILIGLGSAGAIAFFTWLFKRFRLRTKVEIDMDLLRTESAGREKRLKKVEDTCQEFQTVIRHQAEMCTTLNELALGNVVTLKCLCAVMVAIEKGECNGEMHKAHEALDDFYIFRTRQPKV